jgi:hypothetical protein
MVGVGGVLGGGWSLGMRRFAEVREAHQPRLDRTDLLGKRTTLQHDSSLEPPLLPRQTP